MMKHIVLLCVITGLLSADFIRNSDQTVTDTKTCLMWQDDEDAKTVRKTWLDAIDYCENLTLGGYNDWRLPNYNELQSIIDYSRGNLLIDPIFQNVISGAYWSSTTSVHNPHNAWYVVMHAGIIVLASKSDSFSLNIRCVRSADN